jgi:hypothetical protein
MPQRKKITPIVITKIRSWVNQGVRAEEIALRVGCTVGTLRVRCSQLRISLRSNGGQRVATSQAWPRVMPHSSDLNSESIPYRPRSSDERDTFERALIVSISEATILMLRSRAASKGLSETGLAASLLERIAQDDLYDAVLDE